METDQILLPDLPAVDGLSFRHPYGEQDANALAAVHAGRAARDTVDPFSILESLPTDEEIRTAITQAATAQQLDHWLVAEVNGQVVGYGVIESWHEEDGRWVYLIHGWVLPEWRGRGLGTAMLHWGENKARRLAAAEYPGEPFEFAGKASSTEPEAAALLLHEGYTVGYTELEMELDPSAPLLEYPLPLGIEVRPALPEHIPLIAESIAESYRSEFLNNRFRDTHSEAAGQAAWYSDPVHDRALWQVAWVGDFANGTGAVAGQVLPMSERGRAVIDEVSVRPAWRRRGLARALLTRALRDLRSRGVTVVRLSTGAEFPTRARDLYTSLGFRIVKEFPGYRKSPAQSPQERGQ
jgi:ribosomal protein S18 acetylase RimI-like enzyme